MLMELFCDWFCGSFNNRMQTFTHPKEARYVMARHDQIFENQIECSYYYHRNKTPYRQMLFDVKYQNGSVHLTDSTGKELVFKHRASSFIAETEHRIDNKIYVFSAVLTDGLYRVNDQCYDLDGDLVRGLPDKSWFEFKKTM